MLNLLIANCQTSVFRAERNITPIPNPLQMFTAFEPANFPELPALESGDMQPSASTEAVDAAPEEGEGAVGISMPVPALAATPGGGGGGGGGGGEMSSASGGELEGWTFDTLVGDAAAPSPAEGSDNVKGKQPFVAEWEDDWVDRVNSDSEDKSDPGLDWAAGHSPTRSDGAGPSSPRVGRDGWAGVSPSPPPVEHVGG
jgi:hypothetical protein